MYVCTGATWTSRTISASWGVRADHTSVIDAAGAIYVIGGSGGFNNTLFFNDVWVIPNGGADPYSRGHSWAATH